ncbi:P-loop containing nucleoside triphosphate hydrolase [Fusarium austroafricanum]|uniref:P-loop containing nucleoside triphosphate hydrolase n=1 Tax=Fusarium austroafricanum TaxID=2364996 RepID=A0A8H4NRB6_9HYPO|nr:P-loop containing nucleoside triphosphate hydrolase [Fusarium austroafricanum]
MEGLSVAASIIQVIDVSSRLISSSIEIYRSQGGQGIEWRELKETATSMAKDIHFLRQGLNQAGKRRDLIPLEKEQKQIGQRCQDIGNELVETLRGLNYGGSRSPWKSFRQAIASAWNDDKIRNLEDRLDRYRQQMVMNVLSSLWLQSENMSRKLDKALSEDRPSRPTPKATGEGFLGLDFLGRITAESRERWCADFAEAILARSWQSQTYYLPGQSSDLPSNHQESKFETMFLQHLKFKDMISRQPRIQKAHPETFGWIFQDTKAKSPKTLENLEAWRRKDKLITASFYFWNSGSNLQMSIIGLLQTLLYECLTELPSAIPLVFPERWKLFKLFGKHDPWQLEELQDAFRTLHLDKQLGAKFFIFIDGLDECNGDLMSLISFILGLCQPSSNVKMCVASRPWVQFENSFKKHPHIFLQDLTKRDIARYIVSSFNANEGFHELAEREPEYAKQLKEEVARKAQGVFLWVNLVVKSLLSGLTDGDGLRKLQERLNELPPDLEDLFRKILNNLDPANKDHASQLFQLVRASHESPTLLTLAFADLDGPDHAFTAQVKAMTESKKISYGKNMRRKLLSRYRGLLEASPHVDLPEETIKSHSPLGISKTQLPVEQVQPDCIYAHKVQYLHRSVKDFIEAPAVWDWVVSFNKSLFSAHLSLARSFLLQLKIQDPRTLDKLYFRETILWCINYSKEGELNGQGVQVALLDELDKTATTLTDSSFTGGLRSTERHQRRNGRTDHWVPTYLIQTAETSFLYLMVMCGMRGYLEEKLSGSERRRIRERRGKPSLLVAATCDFQLLEEWGYGPAIIRKKADLSLVQYLLHMGADPTHEVDGWSALTSAGGQREVFEMFEKYATKEIRVRGWDDYGDLKTEAGKREHSTPKKQKLENELSVGYTK